MLNGDVLDRRKVGLALLFWTSLFQYPIRLDFGVDKFSPAEANATCIDTNCECEYKIMSKIE